jgi:3-keto-L-gulonate-6-phosphate decarboxylase
VGYAKSIAAEWIEVGTPTLTFCGIDVIAKVAESAGAATIVADFKAMDGVGQYFKRAGELGADIATVMAVTTDASIEKAIDVGHECGMEIQVDLLNVTTDDIPSTVERIAGMGADYFLIHLSIDELLKNPEANPLDGLREAVAASDVPVGPVVFNGDQGCEAIAIGASYVVVGYPYMGMANPTKELLSFAEVVRAQTVKPV